MSEGRIATALVPQAGFRRRVNTLSRPVVYALAAIAFLSVFWLDNRISYAQGPGTAWVKREFSTDGPVDQRSVGSATMFEFKNLLVNTGLQSIQIRLDVATSLKSERAVRRNDTHDEPRTNQDGLWIGNRRQCLGDSHTTDDWSECLDRAAWDDWHSILQQCESIVGQLNHAVR